MSWLNVLGIALGLAMDAFAVSIAAGLAIPELTRRHVFRLAFHFGLFQSMMPVLGWLAGRTLQAHISAYDHWIAFGLLTVIGAKMLWEALHGSEDRNSGDPTKGLLLVTLSVATSIDALAVGLSMALLNVSVWGPSLVIGVVAATMTAIGIRFGSRIGSRYGTVAEVIGGVVLLAIGLRILVTHMNGG